jgi:hypothetical protein
MMTAGNDAAATDQTVTLTRVFDAPLEDRPVELLTELQKG